MKKILLPMLGVAVLLFSACSWQLPKKVSVKTQADYELSLGNALFEKLDTDQLFADFDLKTSIMEGIQLPNSQVYDYFPNSKDETLQQFLIKIPIQEIPVNFSEYMSNSDFATEMGEMSINDEKIEIPNFNDAGFKTSLSADSVQTALAALLIASGTSVDGEKELEYETSSDSSFSSITLSYGQYYIQGDFSDYTTVYLKNTDGSESASATFYGGFAQINLNDFTFTPSTKIVTEEAKSYDAVLYDCKVKNASGVTMQTPALPVTPVEFELLSTEAAENFKKAVIKTGSIEVAATYYSTWSGITAKYAIGLSGSLNITKQILAGNTLNLAGKEVSGTSATTLDADVYLTMTNASLDFSDSSKDYSISISASNSISEFTSVTVKVGKADAFKKSSSNDLPEEFQKTVKEIWLLSSGIKGTYKNTLPEGNPIKFSIKSDFLGLDKTATLESGTESGEYSLMSGLSEAICRKIGNGSGEFNAIDYEANILLPGATSENPNLVTLNNVKPSESYTIGIQIDSSVDYEKIVIDTSGYEQEGKQSLGLNISSMFADLSFGDVNIGEKVQLSRLPLYLIAVKPDGDSFENVKFTGSVKMYMGDAENNVVNDSENKPAELELLPTGSLDFSSLPKLNEDSNKLVTIDFAKTVNTKGADLAELLNKKVDSEASLCISYSIEFSNTSGSSELTLTKELMESSEVGSIAIYAYLELPLEFNVTENLNLPVVEADDSEESSASSDESSNQESDTLDTLLEVIKEIGFTIKPSKLPFHCEPAMEFELGLTSDVKKTLKLGNVNEVSEFTLSGSQASSVINGLVGGSSLSPTVNLKINKGLISIPREMGFDASVTLTLSTDGEIDVSELIGGNK
ncbi:MAG: hypothetical protein IJ688_12160 [Treponema sp.]|nr:hypothetical protein [Treponema sp.]